MANHKSKQKTNWIVQQLKIDRRCDYCDRELSIPSASIDHIIPQACGLGWDLQRNWALACRPCNFDKGCDLKEPLRRRLKIEEGCGDIHWDGQPWLIPDPYNTTWHGKVTKIRLRGGV